MFAVQYSLPTPKGGKHSVNPITAPDQKHPHQRVGKKAQGGKYDVFDPDYVAMTSPFAPTDVHSRAAQLGFGGSHSGGGFQKRRNPNEKKKLYGRRK